MPVSRFINARKAERWGGSRFLAFRRMIEQSFDPLMPDYRHDRILDETYFFTVNLLERRMDLPNAYIGVLREGASDAVHFVHHILRELEDFALDEAIREGLETERIMREEVFSIFQGRA